MKNRNIVFCVMMIFIFCTCVSLASAQDPSDLNSTAAISDTQELAVTSNGIEEGCVSGDVDIATSNSYQTKGELDYTIPAEARDIKSAHVYVNVYSGSAQPTYGAYSNVTLETSNNFTQLGYEELWYGEGSTDGVVYTVNDHITKCYSDYMVSYDVTNILKGLNGTSIKISVVNSEYPNKNFYAKIKMIALVLAYDDGDDDEINYWINSNQRWSQEDITDVFSTKNVNDDRYLGSELINVALSSSDGAFKFNDRGLSDAVHQSGNYYQFNKWDVTDYITFGEDSVFYSKNMGMSIKDVISILKIRKGTFRVQTSLSTEYPDTCYAGTANLLTAEINVQKMGSYEIKLFADGTEVNSTTVQLKSGINRVSLTDPTVRPVDDSAVNGNPNCHVNYTVEVISDNISISRCELNVPVLYDGYLSNDFAYASAGYESAAVCRFTGDIVIDIKPEESVYQYGVNRTDMWNVSLSEGSTAAGAWIYVPYKAFDNVNYVEDEGMFDASFNGEKIAPAFWYRDQSNLGEHGSEGYGILIYDVRNIIVNGSNTFNLNKINPTPSLYPTALIYLTNSSRSKVIKSVYFINGADLLASDYNALNRTVELNTEISIVNSSDIADSTLYVFAASAQNGEGNVIFNGKSYDNVWNDGVNSLSLFETNVTGAVESTNCISFTATGGQILALPQFIVTTEKLVADISLETEYLNTCCAGTDNTLKITVDAKKVGNYTVRLYADGVLVNSTGRNIDSATEFYLTDPTVRAVDESTVSGASNRKVNYTAELLFNGAVINSYELIVPVLYNGYLSREYSYGFNGFEEFLNMEFTGDLVMAMKDDSTYMSTFDSRRTDEWNVNQADSSSIVKAFIYVAYLNLNSQYSVEDIEATFNGVQVTAMNYYDQSNLGNNERFGLLVYDVADIIRNGENSFVLVKKYPAMNICPSVLVYICNDTESYFIKRISVVNNVDLLQDECGRVIQSDSVIGTDSENIANSTVYMMFGGNGNVSVNGNPIGYAQSAKHLKLISQDITDIVRDENNVSYAVSNAGMLTLSEMIVNTYVSKAIISPENLSAAYASGKTFNIAVTANSNPIKGFDLTLRIYTGNKYADYSVSTGDDGIARFSTSVLSPSSHVVEIIPSDDTVFDAAGTKALIKITKAKTAVKAAKVTFKFKKSKYFKVTVKNKATKKAIKGIKVKVKVFTGKKSKTYTIKTDKKGVAKINTKKLKVGKHKVVVSSADSRYDVSAKSSITIKK